jgi:HAD superfamily hydrolase (TIGR01509 family)
MIKLIIFDLSGVISNAEEPIYLEKFAEDLNVNLEELQKIYFEYLEKSERGEIPLSVVWGKTLEKFNIQGDYKEFVKDMMSLKEFNKDVLEFVLGLRKKYKMAFFTNYAEEYWKIHETLIDLSRYFDFGVVSYQIGSRKPEVKGFKKIIEHFDVKPEETVFLDDSEKNLKNAKEMGINTVHYKGLERLKGELEKIA